MILKKYTNFINEKYDQDYRHKIWWYVTDLCRNTLTKDILNNWENGTSNNVIINILDEFYYDWNWIEASELEIWENIYHWVGNYLRDDGSVSIDGDKIVPYNVETKRYYEKNPIKHKPILKHDNDPYDEEEWEDNKIESEIYHGGKFETNITQTNAALWILEKYNIKIPCDIVHFTRGDEEILGKYDSLSEALIDMKKFKSKMKCTDNDFRLDTFYNEGVSSTYIIPDIQRNYLPLY